MKSLTDETPLVFSILGRVRVNEAGAAGVLLAPPRARRQVIGAGVPEIGARVVLAEAAPRAVEVRKDAARLADSVGAGEMPRDVSKGVDGGADPAGLVRCRGVEGAVAMRAEAEIVPGLQHLGAENWFRRYEIGRVRTGCLVLVEKVRYVYTPFQ